jgi:hypothetical protein
MLYSKRGMTYMRELGCLLKLLNDSGLPAVAMIVLVMAGAMVGYCQAQEGADSCDKVVTLTSFPKMVFRPVNSPAVKPRNPVAKMTIREDGSVSKVELLTSSKVKAWDEEVLDKMKIARYSEAHGCGERTSEMQIRVDYTH